MRREIKSLNSLVDQLKEENADLKCKVVEAEAQLSEERLLKEVKLEKRIENQRQDALAQCWEYKMTFEDRINLEKERYHKLSQEKITLEEKCKRLQIQLSIAQETKVHLEKENVNLSNKLDSETMKLYQVTAQYYNPL